MDTQESDFDTNNNNKQKPKLFQFKYHNQNNSKAQLQARANGQQKLSLRSNTYKHSKRAESTADNFFQGGTLRSSMGPRGSVQDVKKTNKIDGFEMLARGTADNFKKFEPIGKTLQTFQQQKRQQQQQKGGSQQSLKPSFNNFGVYTNNNNNNSSQQKMHRANSTSQGLKFNKTASEGFGGKRAFTYFSAKKNNLVEQNNNNTQEDQNNSTNNNNTQENNENNNVNNKGNSTNSTSHTNNNNTNNLNNNIKNTQSNFNFKKSSTTSLSEKDNNNINSNRKLGGAKKRLSEAVNKANMYNDEIVRKQHQFAIQEKEEELQFLELCETLNNLIVEQ